MPVSGKSCGFRGSVQHLRTVYSLESESPKFFVDVDLNVARLVDLLAQPGGRESSTPRAR